MSLFVLIDSSAWTQTIRRRGDASVRDRVQGLIDAGRAAWCEVIRLELWKGAASEYDRKVLQEMEQALERLEINQQVWDLAAVLAQRTRAAGQPMPTTDLVIFACAQVHGAELEHRDKHFEILGKLSAS